MRNVTEIIVHCTATPQGKDFTVSDVDRWHRANGWDGIGYHWLVYRDGTTHPGRDEAKAGAHCKGHNARSVGVCYVGGLATDGRTPKDTRTQEQKAALLKLLKELRRRYPAAKIYGHRDFAAKACPSFDARKEYAVL